jgi:hypothetical protein
VVITNAMPRAACESVMQQMKPYLDACHRDGGAGSSRDSIPGCGCVIARSRSSWEFVAHPVLRGLCEGVLGRQVLGKSERTMQDELFADRKFKQHPYRLDCTQVRGLYSRG